MDQVLVVLVAEEALAQLGQPVLSALQGAHELLLPVAQQDVVVGPLADEGLWNILAKHYEGLALGLGGWGRDFFGSGGC